MVEESSGRDLAAQVRDLARVVREQKWLILLCVVVTTAAAVALTAVETPKYRATAKLLLQQDTLSQTLAGTALGPQNPTRQAATDAQLVSLPAVAERVSREVDEPLSSAAVNTSINGDSSVLSVNVTDPDAARAALFANAFAREYIAFRRETNRDRITAALRTLSARRSQLPSRTTPEARNLRNQARQLRLLASLQTGDAQVVQPAIKPASPISPKPARNTLLGVIVGLLLGFALAVLRDRLDRRLKKEEDLEEIFPDVPIVALVPEPRRRRAQRLLVEEAFHMLQTNIGFLRPEADLRTLLVTSAGPGEGKSTVALNLALALRAHGRSAVVVDADMRRPALSDVLMADRRVGVSQILAGKGSVANSIQEREVDPDMNGNGPAAALKGSVALLPAGPTPPNPQVLLQDGALGSLLDAASSDAETVIVDGPPIGAFSDMLPVARRVDGVIVVVRLYHSRRDELRRFARDLQNVGTHPIGIVVLGAASEGSRYYDYYNAQGR